MRENNRERECMMVAEAKYTLKMGGGCYTPRSKGISKEEMQKQE